MNKIAVYPGSFDPITIGHVDIIQRVANVFDQVIILVSQSSQKDYLFSAEQRVEFVRNSVTSIAKDKSKILVESFSGLTIDYMKKKNAGVIIRGLRAVADFEYEGTLANMNKRLNPEIETFMIFSKPEFYFISSRGVKEIALNHGPLQGLVPDFLISEIEKKFR